MREGFLPQVSLRGGRLGQNGEPAPAPSPAPSGGDSGDNGNDFNFQGFPRFPFFPTFYNQPSYPFYWNQPYYPPVAPARPRYICTKEEDEEGEERFICEPETPPAPPVPTIRPVAPFFGARPSLFYVRPYAGSFFF